MVSASGVQRLFVYFVAHSDVASEMGHKLGESILGDETFVRSDTLSGLDLEIDGWCMEEVRTSLE